MSFVFSRRVPRPWPHRALPLSPEQERIREDWVSHWLESTANTPLVRNIYEFNHSYPARSQQPGLRTLEIGSGIGMHCRWENLETQDYYCNELTPSYAAAIKERYPFVSVTVGDCQEHLDFEDGFFNRILAIHVLEHLPHLPQALDETKRLLAPGGVFSVVIPCEGGICYELMRMISSKRRFESRYKGQSYEWLIRSEHVNTAWECLAELNARFRVVDRTYYPLRLPLVDANMVIGITLTHP